MALKIVMLQHKLSLREKELETLRGKAADFETREAQLEAAIAEAETEEQQEAVSQQVEAFEQERSAHNTSVAGLETTIAQLREEITQEQEKEPKPEKRGRGAAPAVERDGRMEKINIRSLPKGQRAFDAFGMEAREAMVAREDVKGFLQELRTMKGQQRAISGGELTIPEVMLEIISENMFRYSKLLNRIRVRNVAGNVRQTIAGTVPEAVWTEMCGAINELSFGFGQVDVDGYKVAGFVPVCNALLEDSDINLAGEVVEMISEAIGLAVDKAILYGKGAGAKMPTGIVTRLAQQSKPSDYPAKAPEWVDLHTSNLLKVDGTTKTGAEFWADLTLAAGNTFTRYGRGEQFWAMNSKTYAKLKAKLITFGDAGHIVSGLQGVLPVIGGNIDVLEFIPDGDIIGGYGDLYLAAVRKGMTVDASAEVQFIQDNTVYRGKMRMDGMPVIPGAFVAINIDNKEVTTAMDFAADTANDAKLTEFTVGTATFTFKPETYTYTATASGANGEVKAIPAQAGATVEVTYKGKAVGNGGTVKFETGTFPLVATVKQGNAVRVYTVNITKS